MFDTMMQLLLFSAKTLILVIFILLLFAGLMALFAKGKEKITGKVTIKNLNKHFTDTVEELMTEILPKKQLKHFFKEKKIQEKKRHQEDEKALRKNVFVIQFHGDVRASEVTALREKVTAVIGIAKPQDEVVVCLESPGGMVHAYGLAASQLQRIRDQQLNLTVIVDKVAASGGYLMASVANKILAAPFAIIGSIGVIVQIPNFHRLLKEKNIDFEQLTAGNFKRTLTMFGQNTEEGREKLQEEIEEIHTHFKEAIQLHRPQIDINQVATGEHWLASKALELNLVDGLTTSDDYLLWQSKSANIYEVCYHTKKSLVSKLLGTGTNIKQTVAGTLY